MKNFKTYLEEQSGKGLTIFDIDETMFITKAKTSIIKPEFNIDYHETGSLIHLVNGTTLTCTIEPKLLVEQIEYITNK